MLRFKQNATAIYHPEFSCLLSSMATVYAGVNIFYLGLVCGHFHNRSLIDHCSFKYMGFVFRHHISSHYTVLVIVDHTCIS